MARAGGAHAAVVRLRARSVLEAKIPGRLGGRIRLLVRRVHLDSVRARSPRRHGEMGRLGHVHFVRDPQGPAHGSVRRAGRIRDASLVGHPGVGGIVDRAGTDTRAARLRLARFGKRGNRHARAHAPGADHWSLRSLIRVRDDRLRGSFGRIAQAEARAGMAADSSAGVRAARARLRSANARSVGGATQRGHGTRMDHRDSGADGGKARAAVARA